MKVIIALLTLALTGCAAIKPGRNALATVSGVLEAEHQLMTKWALHTAREEQRIASLPAIEQGTQAADLLRLQGRVAEAHGLFLKARLATEKAMIALAQSPDKTAPPSELLAAFSNLVTATAQ